MRSCTNLPLGFFVYLFFVFSMLSCIKQEIKKYNLPEAFLSKTDTTHSTLASQTDTALYRLRMLQLSNGDPSGLWPPHAAQPMPGSLIPFNRIVAFYGNFYSKKMGVLGALPTDQMINLVNLETQQWKKADSLSPVVPAIHYIAVSAQNNPGPNGKFRLRMPFHQIEKALSIADAIGGIVILDIQVGLSTLEQELPRLDTFLILPQVHLGIDPEYSMKNGSAPGTSVGIFDAADINYASAHLGALVDKHKLPPKVLIVHRFTTGMVSHSDKIETRPQVQLVMNMDGFGFPELKRSSYYHVIYKEPVQFAGFKLFYKNDTFRGNRLMRPEEILRLIPQPVYIQYQ